MDREEVVLLLKELMTECESFSAAKAVSIAYNRATGSWELHVSWTPHPLETDCLKKLTAKHSSEMVTANEKTVFR